VKRKTPPYYKGTREDIKRLIEAAEKAVETGAFIESGSFSPKQLKAHTEALYELRIALAGAEFGDDV